MAMEVESSGSKKRTREELPETTDSSLAAPPSKKQKTDHVTGSEEKSKECTPPLILDEEKEDKKKRSNPQKPPLAPAPSTGMIETKKRAKKPGLAKVPSNLLAFNGLIVEEEKKEKKSSDKQEAEDNKSEIDIDRQILINEIKELLAPCSRELIEKGMIKCCIWFDEDDDGNTCLWIAKIEEIKFDESIDVTSMLCRFPGYDDNIYWLPIIFKTKWLVFQPNQEILLKNKYKHLCHQSNLEKCKDLLSVSKEYLSDISCSDIDIDIDEKKKKKKKVYKRKKDRIKTKRKTVTTIYKPRVIKYPTTTKYAQSDKRLQSLDDVDTTTITFTPISKKHLVLPPDITNNDEIDHELIEILFSFDTTGSMSRCLDSVRMNLKNILNLLFRDIAKIRIGILAHGDYCDENVYYVMRWVDLTDDKDKLIKFVDETTGTGGGDVPEAYELVLHNASRQIGWSSKCINRSLVLIGDANPHELGAGNPYKLDWREKAKDCKSCGIKIYGIHCLSNVGSKNFYETISDLSGGVYITLDKIQSFAGMMVALCHREKDLIQYNEDEECEQYKKEKIEHNLLFNKLEEFSVLGLKEMLRHNAQKVSGTKYELISRVIDCKMYGNMARCTQCGGGHLRVIYINGKKYGHHAKGRYFCPGYYDGDEYVACLWTGDETKVKREKWREIDVDVDDIDIDIDIDNNAHNKNK